MSSASIRQSITQSLADEHGPLMDAGVTAKVLGFKSADALRQARRDGRLPINMFRLPGRRGWWASTEAVINWLDGQIEPHLSRTSITGGRP